MPGLEDTSLGPYELVQHIGGGGMAEVYLARQSTAFGREVAVKVIRSGFSEDKLFRERFLREAQAIAKLSHPNILPLIEFGEQGQMLYLVMPLAREGTLRDLLRQQAGPLALEVALPLLSQLCDAVQYAHEQGIIHRDLKPQNVLMQQRTHVLLADFGIARDSAETQLTATGAGLGTVEFMAPEQAVGKADARSDIYSLGIVLYQLLTGTVPFSGTTPFQVLLKHTTDPLPDPRTFNPGLSNELVEVLKTTLAKDPNQRFQSAQALKHVLQQVSQGSAAAARPVAAIQPPAPGASGSPQGTVSGAAPLQPLDHTLETQSEPSAPSPDTFATASEMASTLVVPLGTAQPPRLTQESAPTPGGWAGHTPPGAQYDLPTWSGPEDGFPQTPGSGGPQGSGRGGPPLAAGGQPVHQPPKRRRRLGLIALGAVLVLLVLLLGRALAFGFTGARPQTGAATSISVVTTPNDPTALPPTTTWTATATATPTATPTATLTPTPTANWTPTPRPVPPGQLIVSPSGLGEKCAALSDFVTLSNTGGQAVSWGGGSTNGNFVIGPSSGTLAAGANVSVQIKGGDPTLVLGNSFSVFFKWSGPTIFVTVTCK